MPPNVPQQIHTIAKDGVRSSQRLQAYVLLTTQIPKASGSHNHHSQANSWDFHAASLGTRIANSMSSHPYFSSYEAKGTLVSLQLLETWQRRIMHSLYQGGNVINNTELCTRLLLIRANDELCRAAPKPGASVSTRATSRCTVERRERGRARREIGQALGAGKLGPALLMHALPNGKRA